MDRPIVVRKADLRVAGGPTTGVTRSEAFADEHVWVGRIENEPNQASGWHVHPGHDTYAAVLDGRFFIEFGLGGADRVELDPGDFALIPKGMVHREGNATAAPTVGIAVRVGEGPITVNLDGPQVAAS